MKILNFNDFCNLPDGTIFSYWEPQIAEGLYRRGEVLRNETSGKAFDFCEASLIARGGYPPEVDLDCGRWGMFNYDQLFLVYEPADIAKIAEGLGIIPLAASQPGSRPK